MSTFPLILCHFQFLLEQNKVTELSRLPLGVHEPVSSLAPQGSDDRVDRVYALTSSKVGTVASVKMFPKKYW